MIARAFGKGRFGSARVAVAVATTVLTTVLVAPVAHADVSDTLNAALFPKDCSIQAFTPTMSSLNVRSSASVTCGTKREAIVVEVCTQYRQAVVAEDTTWQQLGVCGQGNTGATGGKTVSASTSNHCITGEWAYRTVATAEIHKNDQIPANGTGLAISPTAVYNCTLTTP